MNKQFTKNSGPKYLQIKEIISKEIAQGVYCVGDKIPSENVLPKRFNVSKMTVVKAIDELARDGVLERVRGSGTYVSAKAKTITLNVGLFGDNSWIFDEFESENPTIKLNRICYTHENIVEVAVNNDIDVFYLTDYDFCFFKNNEKLLDLTDVLESEIFEEKKFFNEVLNIFEYRRKQYAAPILFSPLIMFYNKKIFDECVISYPEEGWDNFSFLKKAKALTAEPDNDGVINRYGFLVTQYRNRWPVYVLQEGGCIMDESCKKCNAGSPEVIAALKWVADMLHKHKVCPIYPHMDKNLSQSLFLNGRVAMIIDSYYSLRTFLNDEKLNCGIAPLPKGRRDVTGLISDSLAISKKCKNVDAAAKLLKFALSDKVQMQIKACSFGIPSVKNIALSDENIPEGVSRKEYFMFVDILPKAERLFYASRPELLNPFWKHADMVLANMESPQSACTAAEKEINNLIEKETRH
jgi:multiple sugar transport system substrate-binding protein